MPFAFLGLLFALIVSAQAGESAPPVPSPHQVRAGQPRAEVLEKLGMGEAVSSEPVFKHSTPNAKYRLKFDPSGKLVTAEVEFTKGVDPQGWIVPTERFVRDTTKEPGDAQGPVITLQAPERGQIVQALPGAPNGKLLYWAVRKPWKPKGAKKPKARPYSEWVKEE